MGKVLKRLAIFLAGLVAVFILLIGILNILTNARLNKTYSIQVGSVTIPEDAVSIAQGEHLATIHCKSCHGPDLAGTTLFSDPALGIIFTPNITGGYGNGGVKLNIENLVSAIRHGVDTEGKALMVMPALAFYHLRDQDLGAVIAYLYSLPHGETTPSESQLTVFGKAAHQLGAFGNILHAETLDHQALRPQAVPVGVTVEYGEYMVVSSGCSECHGLDLAGGKSPNPESPPAPSLTKSGSLGGWTEADFVTAMRTGATPDGRHLSPFMAWQWYGQMTDDELSAVWMYLQMLPVAAAQK